MIPDKWKRLICHVGRARHPLSVVEIGLVPRWKERKEGRHTQSTSLSRSIQQRCRWSRMLKQILVKQEKFNINFIGDLNKMLCTGFICQQHKMHVGKTGSDAIIKYQSVPKDCVVKVVSENGKIELFARQLTARERPRITLRPWWVHTRSNPLISESTASPTARLTRKSSTC